MIKYNKYGKVLSVQIYINCNLVRFDKYNKILGIQNVFVIMIICDKIGKIFGVHILW